MYLIVTLFVNFKHNFHKENETFFTQKIKRFKEKSLKMEQFSSELSDYIHDWLIISLKDFYIVFRKWPTFLPSMRKLVLLSIYREDQAIRFQLTFLVCESEPFYEQLKL